VIQVFLHFKRLCLSILQDLVVHTSITTSDMLHYPDLDARRSASAPHLERTRMEPLITIG